MSARILLVYNADGGLLGELSYVAGKVLGTAKCALCDITHKGAFERSEWKQCRASVEAQVLTRHRNEISEEAKAFIAGQYPAAIYEDGHSREWILRPNAFDALRADPAELTRVLKEFLDAR